MGLLLLALLVIVVVAILIGITFSLLGLILHLLVAGLVGWLADLIVPGRIPFGWIGAIAAGLVGSWLGTVILYQSQYETRRLYVVNHVDLTLALV